MRRCGRFMLSIFLAIQVVSAPVAAAPPAAVPANALDHLSWRLIGPFRAGRAIAATGVPGQPDHFYFGAVDGGVWETRNAGRTWDPIFDAEDVGSIGAIAVAPSDVQTIYVGTGEADMRSDIAYGNGMYKSTDGGKTWSHIGLEQTWQIGSVVVDPRDANVVYVAALGRQYGPNPERGVFKTVDGGKTWSKVLFKNDDTGAIDLALDPSNPSVIYASLWQTRRPPWNVYPPSNGPGSGLYKSSDGGATWTQLTRGLPAKVGRIGIAVSPSMPQRVYALVDSDAEHGGVYRSDDAGATWTHTDGDQRIWQRGWYFGGITADPKRPDVAYVMNTSTYRTIDGGKNFDVIKGAPGGDDYHLLWIEPDDSNRMILASDQGTVVSVDGAKTWSSWYNQPTGQFYHVITDDRFPYWVYGAQQDSGADMQPSQTKYLSINDWVFHPIDVGGENGYIAPDPKHPGLIYGGTVTKERPDTGWEQNIDPTLAYPGTVWRGTWTLPLAFSPADRTSIYFGRQFVFRSIDGGNHWTIISPDLSRPNEGAPSNLDAPTLADNNGLTRHGVVYAIAPSPLQAKLIWAGTDDGYVWVTRNGGANWQNVTPPALTSWSKVGIIEAGHFDARTAYLAIDRHRLNDYRAYIYRTHDGGTTWTQVANGIPDGSFVNVVREDPVVPGLLYAGTEKGVYVSFDDGAHWQALQRNLPVTSIRDIDVHGADLVIATHGRAFWVMDDIASLRELARGASLSTAVLFAPQPAYRIRSGNDEGTPLPLDEPHAQNPAPGVAIDYYLPAQAQRVDISIANANGAVLRRWSSADAPQVIDPKSIDVEPIWAPAAPLPSAQAGSHRFVWGFQDGSDDGPLVPPGRYVVTVTADGKSMQQAAVVLRDPRITATDADLQAQYTLAKSILALRSEAAALRKRAVAAKKPSLSALIGAEAATSPDDSVGSPPHDFTSLLYLEGALANLEAAVESADAAPTSDMVAAFAKLRTIYQSTSSQVRSAL